MSNLLPEPALCWEAVRDNDSTHDGQFVYAVRTTGIYCRPSCPSRLPARKNVTFFALPDEAEAAGYRACKRCQPRQCGTESDIIQRVRTICDYIAQHPHDDISLRALGERFHLSPSHLQRQFRQYTGISPRQYAEACRMSRFKDNLRQGQPVTEAIYAAGFNAVSQVYTKLDSQQGMTPTSYQQGGENTVIHYTTLETTTGAMLIATTERGICSLTMGDSVDDLVARLHEEFHQADFVQDESRLAEAVRQVVAYLAGDLPHFDLPLDIQVTAFQKRVLDELQRIPFGETRSYADIARAIGKPKAARAVGQACGANPVPLIIPCHRVVRSDGRIEGYAFGTQRKRQLLEIEQQATPID